MDEFSFALFFDFLILLHLYWMASHPLIHNITPTIVAFSLGIWPSCGKGDRVHGWRRISCRRSRSQNLKRARRPEGVSEHGEKQRRRADEKTRRRAQKREEKQSRSRSDEKEEQITPFSFGNDVIMSHVSLSGIWISQIRFFDSSKAQRLQYEKNSFFQTFFFFFFFFSFFYLLLM